MNALSPNLTFCATLSLQEELLVALIVPLAIIAIAAGIALLVSRLSTPPPVAAPVAADLQSLQAATTQIPEETLALISAAVWAVWGSRARVAQVREVVQLVPVGETTIEWSREGRRDIYASHHVR